MGMQMRAMFAVGDGTLDKIGLTIPNSWLLTIGFAVAWLVLMLAYSPVADWLATQWIATPPSLGAFRALQQSKAKLVAGIAVAWVLGAGLEEIVFRGIVLRSVASFLTLRIVEPFAIGIAVCVAAFAAGLVHFYQGRRAVVIVTQLSLLFGLLFVVSGCNLWAVMLCHGLYDTVAFLRFANKRSKYSNLNDDDAASTRI
jgi:membrane protease YdiL (CAAX protease family)